MKGFYAALIAGAVGIGTLAAIATESPSKSAFDYCSVVEVFEDGSFHMSCPPVAEPNWGPDGFEPTKEWRHY